MNTSAASVAKGIDITMTALVIHPTWFVQSAGQTPKLQFKQKKMMIHHDTS
jgi:hypothetical protein